MPENPSIQKEWDSIVVRQSLNIIRFIRDDDIARFLALQKSESGAWLHALPSKLIGTLLDNNTFRIIMGLRLGLEPVGLSRDDGKRVDGMTLVPWRAWK